MIPPVSGNMTLDADEDGLWLIWEKSDGTDEQMGFVPWRTIARGVAENTVLTSAETEYKGEPK